MSKLIKRGLAIVGVLATLIIVAAIAIPYYYKDKFVALIKEEASNSVKAKIDFADVDLSLFTGFPNLKVRIEEIKVKGIEEFEDITLFECPVLAMDVDLIQLWKSESAIPIMAINAIEPVLNILVLQNGKANWDIVKPSEDTGDSADYLVQLQQYGVDKGHLIYNKKKN